MNIFPSTVKEIYILSSTFLPIPARCTQNLRDSFCSCLKHHPALTLAAKCGHHSSSFERREKLVQSLVTSLQMKAKGTHTLFERRENRLSLATSLRMKESCNLCCLLPHHFGWKKAATYASEFSHTSFERRKRKGWAYGSHHFGWKKAATKLKESKRFATPPLWCGWGGHRDSWE